MVEAVIYALIALCIIVGLVWLVLWVFGKLGIALPERVIQIVWVIVVLVCILILYRMLAPVLGGYLP